MPFCHLQTGFLPNYIHPLYDIEDEIVTEDFSAGIFPFVQKHLEPILKTPELPIYSKATMPLKEFRDEKTKNKKQI